MQVGFYRGNGEPIFCTLVRWWTRGAYSHAELIHGDYSYSASFKDGGVRAKPVVRDAGGILLQIDGYPASDWDIFDLVGFDEGAALEWFRAHNGAPYDLLGLLGCVIRAVGSERGAYYCSESVACSLGFAEAWRLDPSTLAAVLRRQASSVAAAPVAGLDPAGA